MIIGIISFIVALIPVFVALYLFVRLIKALLGLLKKRPSKRAPEREPRSAVDEWVEEALARELGRKVDEKHGVDADGLLSALRGDPDPSAVTLIEEALKVVKLTYERLPEDGQFYVRAEMIFEDGSTTTGTHRFARADLPELIRDEFARTGGSFVYRDWHLPWYGPDRGWAS